MNITINDMMISENIQKLHWHMTGNFFGNPFGEVLDLITNEFINYWNGDCAWDFEFDGENLYDNLEKLGIHCDDIERLMDPCFMTDDDADFFANQYDEQDNCYDDDVECEDDDMYDQLGFSMEETI
jgi:hypothetical protein